MVLPSPLSDGPPIPAVYTPTQMTTYDLCVYSKMNPSSVSLVDVGVYTAGIGGPSDKGEGNTITHPYSGNYTVWVSAEKQTYEWSMSGLMCFNQDPTDDLKKVIAGEMSFSDLHSVSPVTGKKYWIVGFTENSSIAFEKNYLMTNPNLIYLEKGTWTINVVDTNCKSLNLYNANYLIGGDDDSKRFDLTGGKGSVKLEVQRPTAYYFQSYEGGSYDTPWLSYTIEYNIDPVPQKEEVTNYSDKATVLTNYQWVKYTTNSRIDGRIALEWDRYIYFAQGSSEEADFLENVVSKNRTNGSAYSKEYLDVYNQKVVFYGLSRVDGYTPSIVQLQVNTSHEDIHNPDTKQMEYSVVSERIPTGEDTNSKFYAGKTFSMSVKYDTDRILYVAIAFTNLFGENDYAPLESGRLYEFEMESAAEYQIYALLKEGADDMSPVEVEIYTSGIAEKDNYGMVFAVIAIILCVIAFGTLFMAGRKPKWNDSTGLPDGSDTVYEAPSEPVPEPEVPEENNKDE